MRKSQPRQLRSVLQYARQQVVYTCTVCNKLRSKACHLPWSTLPLLSALLTSCSLSQWTFQHTDAAVPC